MFCLGAWLLPLTLGFVRFICFTQCSDTWLLLIAAYYSTVSEFPAIVHRSTVDRHLDCYQFHVFMKMATMNILTGVFW